MDVKVAALETMKLIEDMDNHKPYKSFNDRSHTHKLLSDIVEGKTTGMQAHRWLAWSQCAIYSSSNISLETFKLINKKA